MKKRRQERQLVTVESPITIERLTPTGQGIATLPDGVKLFLWNALPGELITEFYFTKQNSHFKEGIATAIAQSSPNRISPLDAHCLSTSPWQILSEPAEITAKESLLQEIFRPLSSHLPTQVDIHLTPSPQDYFYRNKMEYALYFDHTDNLIHPAVHCRGTHRKIPITASSIEFPEIFDAACEIIASLNANGDQARRYQSLLLRSDQTGRVSGGLYENGQPHPDFAPLTDTLLGYTYSYSVNGFFQINLPSYQLALKRIAKLLPSNTSRVLDLYSGVGTIGLTVARERDLTLVEVNGSAYQELEQNVHTACRELKALGITPHITPVLAKSEEALEYITPDSVVILDPPRAGCHEALISKLLEVHPRQIIYLSCNPATQVRDLSRLIEVYSITSLEAFNFFPRTPHIETLVNLCYNI